MTVGQTSAPPGARRAAALRSPWPALAALVALGAALRFATLATQSIWFDEAATWDLVRLPFGAMLRQVAHHESSPPLFYLLEWGWTHLFGTQEWGLRSLSALAGTLTVPVGYAIGRRLGGATAGLATAALIAVNPLLVWFSQEARAYALVVGLSAVALWLFLRCLDDERPRSLAAWAAVSMLALATHYFAAFVLAPQAAWLLWRHPRRRAALAAVAALGAAGAALLPLLLEQRGNPYDIAGESIALRLAQVPKQFLLGYRGPLPLALGLAGAGLVAAAAWLVACRTDARVRRGALLVAAIGAIGVVLPFAAALVHADYLNTRNALPALVPLAAALGVACGASRSRPLGTTLLAGLCALSVAIAVAVAADASYQRPDWSGLSRALGRQPFARAIVISPANGEAALRFYRRGLRTMSPQGTLVREVDVVAVAGSTRPGGAPKLPSQFGTALGVPGFGPPQRIVTPAYELLRFRAAVPTPVIPNPLGALRFSERYPSVDVLPANG
jgi:4-amino-4-deoxy-L-arabinose transferase-like glycosyltransferase